MIEEKYLQRLIEDFIKKHPKTEKRVLDEITQYMCMAYCLGMDSRPKSIMKKFNRIKFAKTILMERVTMRRISIRKCAKEIGIHFNHVSRYERQKLTPNIDNFLLICKWFDKPPSEFFKD